MSRAPARSFDLGRNVWWMVARRSRARYAGLAVLGGFEGDEGGFTGPDRWNGKPILVPFRWL